MLSQQSVQSHAFHERTPSVTVQNDSHHRPSSHAKDSPVVQAIVDVVRRANRAVRLHLSMPVELLAEIFTHLPVSDRFKAAAVCTHWRETALSCPHVWSDLSDFGPASAILETALQRSHTAPVNLALVFRSPDSHKHLHLLREHLHHIRTLEVEFAEHSLNDFSDVIAIPAPMLECAKISIHGTYGGVGPRLRDDIFAGDAPNLSHLALSHVAPPAGDTPALANVHRLSITLQFARPEECIRLHTSMPRVHEYVLRLMSHPLRAEQDVSHLDAPSLRFLQLPRSLGTLIPALPHTSAERVSMQQTDADAFRRVADGMDIEPTHMLLLKNSTRAGFVMAACCSDNMDPEDEKRERFAHAVACRSPLEFFTPHIEANLRSFTTGAALWRDVRTTIVLPSLRMLALVLPVHDTGESKTPAEHLPMCFATPKLQIVRIAARPMPKRNLILAEDWAGDEPAAFITALNPIEPIIIQVAGSPAIVRQFERFGADIVDHSVDDPKFAFAQPFNHDDAMLTRDEAISRALNSVRVPASTPSTPFACPNSFAV